VENGRLIVAPKCEAKRSTEELVARITPENLHGETDTGSPRGREVW
jgi:antitoxin component of MazEF toxin-antitoxin module